MRLAFTGLGVLNTSSDWNPDTQPAGARDRKLPGYLQCLFFIRVMPGDLQQKIGFVPIFKEQESYLLSTVPPDRITRPRAAECLTDPSAMQLQPSIPRNTGAVEMNGSRFPRRFTAQDLAVRTAALFSPYIEPVLGQIGFGRPEDREYRGFRSWEMFMKDSD